MSDLHYGLVEVDVDLILPRAWGNRLVDYVVSPYHGNHTGLVYGYVPCDQRQSELMCSRRDDAVWHVRDC